jgi:hypothetical protein
MAPAPKQQDRDDPVLVATESFSADIDGVPTAVNAGSTRVRKSHVLAQRYPQYFRPAEEGLTYETATREPGERRGAQT